MIFVKTPASFYALRFLLGIAEAGFFPGMILYLTYWFPAKERAKAVAGFMTAVALSGLVGGPLGGILLKMHGFAGLKGWQWLFLAEGVPSILLGIATFFYLDDRPERARWLSEEKREWLLARLREEEAARERNHGISLGSVFAHPRALLLSAIYFLAIVGLYGLGLWGPLILKERSAWDSVTVSFLWAIPSLIAAVGMVIIGTHSDRTQERRWHVAGSAFLAALGFGFSVVFRSPVPTLLSLSLASLGIMSLLGPFWSLSTGFLSGIAAAGGIAMINSIGNLGGFVGPTLMGALKGSTSDFGTGLLALAGFLAAAGGLALLVPMEMVTDDPSPPAPSPARGEGNPAGN
jgi:ACS family tartrate transporter-like MFS transporter